jgi:hypothetical protein
MPAFFRLERLSCAPQPVAGQPGVRLREGPRAVGRAQEIALRLGLFGKIGAVGLLIGLDVCAAAGADGEKGKTARYEIGD